MPQITLKVSKNVEMSQIDFQSLFVAIHHALGEVPDLNVNTCQSGVIQEDFSYIGLGENNKTKMFLEVLWMESEKRIKIKRDIGLKLMQILQDILVPQVEKQKLVCMPRVRIADLGEVGQVYHVGDV